MTEEIIIDCSWYRNGSCGCATEDKRCEQIKLCKFKDDKLKQQLKRLEQENKRLNERLYCYAYEKDCHLQCKQKDCAIKNYYKYKSALEEIREMCKRQDFNQGMRTFEILKFIDEVLNDSRE